MKFVALFLAALLSRSAFATPLSPEAMTGAAVMMRQVLKQGLLSDANQKYNADVTRALEGSKDESLTDAMSAMTCNAQYGSVFCLITVDRIAIQNGKAVPTSFNVNVRSYQGEVISAEILSGN